MSTAGKPFRINRLGPKPLIDAAPQLATAGQISRRDLEGEACRSCYRPLHVAGYCPKCITSGAAERHHANRQARA
jgi:hypothetical protein